uniref:Uncharacterized protein n=1 Tax=Clastoptera arizonana TaxID=38151 RepID=A0A1B6EGA8_9HEMI
MLYNFVLILVVGHCFSTVSLDFVGMESLQLDLRNELNIITEDVTKKFLEENTFHGHVFHTGIGNREELKVTSFIKNDGFKFGYDVKKWQTLTTKEKIYFLGLTSKNYLILISSSLNTHLNNTTDGSQHIIELPLNVIANAACMFERWNYDNKYMEVLIVIATNSSTSDIIWYKVNLNKAVKFWSWPRYKAVSSMTLLATGKLSHLIIISADEEGSFTTADVYNIMLNKHPPYFSLLQSLPLDESSSSVEVSIIGKNAYLFIPQTNLGSVLVFKYDLSVDNYDYFQRNINISSPSVTQVHSFTTASQSFVAVNGKSPNIYRIKYSGAFVTNIESDFSEVEDFLIIPIHSYRSEVIIFANQNNFTRLLVWKGSIKGFSEDVLPQCNEGQCLDGTFSGAVTFKINNLPSVLLPRQSNYSVLYHIITSLSEVKDPVLTEIFKLKEKRTFIQEFWDRQNNIRKEIKDSLKYVIKANETNKISAVWTVDSIETPLLVQSGRVDSKSDAKNPSSLFSDPENADLNSLKESIKNVTNTISKLKSDIERVKNRDWNFTNYEGSLSVKGTVEINQLSLQELNEMDVDEILNNSLRWDRPKNITGEKIIPSINANQIIFNQINDLYASNLSYKSNPVVLSGNVLFKEKIKVQEFIKLPPQGLVNGMSISKACKLNEICSVNLKLKNVTVYNNMFATEANSQSLDKNYPSQELSEPVKLFAGSNLSVVAINGRNLSDILSNVVYLDKDTYLPHITTVKGTVFTQDRIQLRNLITNQTDPAPQFKDAEERYSEIFKPKWSKKPDKMASLYNSAAATKNQTVNIHPLHNDELLEADVIFTNVEVDGVVLSFENINSEGWADILADVVLKNEVNTEVCGTKIFNNTLQIKKDVYLKGLLNNVNISEVLTSDTEQILFDTRTFFGDITLKNVTLYGDWDGVDINKLDGESVKLYNDETLPSVKLTFEETNNILTNDLTIIDSLNNISVNEVVSYEKIKHGLELNTIKGINLTIMDSLTFSGNISNWDIKELDRSRISCSQDQNVTGIFTINELTVINELSAEKINSINTSDLNYALANDYRKFNYSDILISDLYVSGNIYTTQGIAGYNLSAIAKDAILLTGNSNIKGDLVFEDLLTCNQLDVYVNVGGLNWTDFTKDVVYRHEKHVVLEGEKTFDVGFHVIEDLEIEEINSHRVDHIFNHFYRAGY